MSQLGPYCARNYHGNASVECREDGGRFEFAGCDANECNPLSDGDLIGYDVDIDTSSWVGGLGAVECASGYAGDAVVSCEEDGGNFTFDGCNVTCVEGAGERAGYVIGGSANAITEWGLGEVSCAASWVEPDASVSMTSKRMAIHAGRTA